MLWVCMDAQDGQRMWKPGGLLSSSLDLCLCCPTGLEDRVVELFVCQNSVHFGPLHVWPSLSLWFYRVSLPFLTEIRHIELYRTPENLPPSSCDGRVQINTSQVLLYVFAHFLSLIVIGVHQPKKIRAQHGPATDHSELALEK